MYQINIKVMHFQIIFIKKAGEWWIFCKYTTYEFQKYNLFFKKIESYIRTGLNDFFFNCELSFTIITIFIN